MTTIELLQEIGLNKYEAEAYYTLLMYGAMTGYEVGKRSQVPLSRSYEILERLVDRGLALLQPGDPPRFKAQDPQLFLTQVRTSMETTLTTLAQSLLALAQAEETGEFWIARGEKAIFVQIKAMLTNTNSTLHLILPNGYKNNLMADLMQVQQRGCHIVQTTSDNLLYASANTILIIRDQHEVLLGTLTTRSDCQAVTSTNPALCAIALHFFTSQPQQSELTPLVTSNSNDWLDWEERKQRQLRHRSTSHQVA